MAIESGLGSIGLLLCLCACRLSRLFLGLLVRQALFSSPAHRTDGRSNSRTAADISRDRSDGCSASSTFRCSARASPLGLWRVRGSLLLSSPHVC